MSGWSDDVADAWSLNAGLWSAMEDSRAVTMIREYVVHEVNAILWALLIIVTGLLLRRVWRLLRFWVRGSRLPGPPLNALARNKGCDALDQFTAFLGQAHKEYGAVVRVWLGPTQLLVSVKDPELIQQLLVHAKDRLPLTGKAFQLAFGKSSLFVSSFAQVQSRRISLERQLNGKLLERVHSISLKVVDRIKQWADVGPSGLELDCKTTSQHMAFSILGATLFGDGFLIWPAAREFEDLLMMIAKECCFWATYNVLPIWNKDFQRYKATCLRLQALTEHMIQEGKKTHCNVTESSNKAESVNFDSGIAVGYVGTSGEFIEDLIAGIISSKDSSGYLNLSEEIRGDIMGMMFHGCLTTTGIISGVLTKLAQHPEVQAKVYQEIVSICGKSAAPSFTDVQKMHFLLATIYESARLLPAGPLLQRCSLKHGKFLMERHPHIFWTPCAAHCIDLMLEDLGKLPWIKTCVDIGRNICKYIYNHTWVLNLMRQHTKQKELSRPGVTRFATNFLMLQSMLKSKAGVKGMFVCEEWTRSSYAKTTAGAAMVDMVFDERNFWQLAKEIVDLVRSLVVLLRVADGEKPSMGYICEGMDRVKEAIRSFYVGNQDRYGPLWDVIDRRWHNLLHRPIHAAAYFLNPAYQFSPSFKADGEVWSGLYDVIERMSLDDAISTSTVREVEMYTKAQGDLFAREICKKNRTTLMPDIKLTKEITVPAGAILAVPIQLVQMDACKWGDDADSFNPDRFWKHKTMNSDACEIKGDSHKAIGLTEQGDTDLVENSEGQSARCDFKDPDINVSFLPFGSGSRVCVGKRFASVEMTALLASMLQCYEIKLGPDSDVDLKPKIENFTLQLFPSPKLSLVPRGF